MKSEREFLTGRQSRIKEFLFLIRVCVEFIKGFRVLHFVGPCVAVFGSARFKEDHPYYILGMEVGKRVTELGFTVMTGGGPGIMEAATRGAKEVGGKTVGCNIVLPHEQAANPYLDKVMNFKYFFVRKVLMFKYSYGFVVLPGGVGTIDEMFEALTLIQTRKINSFPIILMGVEYWTPVVGQLKLFEKEGTAYMKELDSLLITDDMDEAMNWLKVHSIDKFGLTKNIYKPFSWLGEKV
jgi:uncharacterized protein (TIGR00730 family)